MAATQAEELRSRAADLYRSGNYDEAVEEYRRLIAITPDSAQALKDLGLALVKAQRIEEGIQACEQAAMLQPADAEVRYACGFALGSARKYSQAAEHLDAALNIQPNHIGAKHALVYSLLTHGTEIAASDDPYAAEGYLDRAHKLDPQNPQATAALLEFYVKTQQKGKAVKMFLALEPNSKVLPALQPIVAKINADSEYQVAVRQAAYTTTQGGITRPASAPQAFQQVPCPNCKQPVMDWTAICPHCNFKIRDIGTFAGRDAGPVHEWQEIVYTIMAVLWSLSAAYDLYRGLQLKIEFLRGPVVILSAFSLICGIGLLFRNSLLAFICKILAYITLFWAAYGVMISLGLGAWGSLAFNVVQIGIAGLLVYLINYVVGD